LQPLLVPDTIRQVLAARIDWLADGPKQVLQTAVILGREVDAILLMGPAPESGPAVEPPATGKRDLALRL
jgi:hypothetical protein